MDEQLLSIIERIEALESTKADIGADIKSVYSESVSQGFDKKAIKQIIKLRKLDPVERVQLDEITELYKQKIGM